MNWNDFLTVQRTCRVATVSADGAPHVSTLWFAWDGTSLWLYSVVRSRRWADLRRDPRVAIVVDTGEEYDELRGAELSGRVEFVGEIPRTGETARRNSTFRRPCSPASNFGLTRCPTTAGTPGCA
ncbi:hypothetical protein GCM10023238_25200 [Streptomyces heliomycini]